MPEKEALTLLNSTTHPTREVLVIEVTKRFLGLILSRLVRHNLFQIIEIKLFNSLREVTDYVLRSDQAILILVQIQKCFPHRCPGVLKSLLQ